MPLWFMPSTSNFSTGAEPRLHRAGAPGRDSRRQDLVRSQKSWLIFRDAEMRFIANNWTPQDFGSSSATSQAAYRAALIRGRVETLLGYLRSYPPGGLAAPAH